MASGTSNAHASSLIGEFRSAGWSVTEREGYVWATCGCASGHKAAIRVDSITSSYAHEKLVWLFNETCYGR
jgi:hypothetical protein